MLILNYGIGTTDAIEEEYIKKGIPIYSKNQTTLVTQHGRWLNDEASSRSSLTTVVNNIPGAIYTNTECGFSVGKVSGEYILKRKVSKIEEPIRLAIVPNSKTAQPTIVRADSVVYPKGSEYAEEILFSLEIDTVLLYPLEYAHAGRVMDGWRKDNIVGWSSVVRSDEKIVLIAVENSTNRVVRIIFDMTNVEKPAIIQSESEFNSARYLKRKELIPDVKAHPLQPTRSGAAPGVLVLCTRDLESAKLVVERALKKYMHLDGIPIQMYTVEYDEDVDWMYTSKVIADEESVQCNTIDTGSINLVKLPSPKELAAHGCSFSDYTSNIDWWFKDFIITRNGPMPLRLVTLLDGDEVTLAKPFRRENKLRYVNMIYRDGTVKPFITNKY